MLILIISNMLSFVAGAFYVLHAWRQHERKLAERERQSARQAVAARLSPQRSQNGAGAQARRPAGRAEQTPTAHVSRGGRYPPREFGEITQQFLP